MDKEKEREPRPKVVLVHRALIQNNNLILLVQRSSTDRYMPGAWELPGGKLESNKDIWQTLHNEVFEETKLTIKPTHPLAYVDGYIIDKGPYQGLPYVILISICQVENSTEVILSEEHDSFQWITIDQALKLNLKPEERKALPQLAKLI